MLARMYQDKLDDAEGYFLKACNDTHHVYALRVDDDGKDVEALRGIFKAIGSAASRALGLGGAAGGAAAEALVDAAQHISRDVRVLRPGETALFGPYYIRPGCPSNKQITWVWYRPDQHGLLAEQIITRPLQPERKRPGMTCHCIKWWLTESTTRGEIYRASGAEAAEARNHC